MGDLLPAMSHALAGRKLTFADLGTQAAPPPSVALAPIKARQPPPTVTVQQPRALIDTLCARWPEAFSSPRKRPLAIGIHKQIRAALGEDCDPDALRAALHLWTRGLGYQIALLRQPHRVGLDGQSAGEITPEQRERAREAVAAMQAGRKAREAAKGGGKTSLPSPGPVNALVE